MAADIAIEALSWGIGCTPDSVGCVSFNRTLEGLKQATTLEAELLCENVDMDVAFRKGTLTVRVDDAWEQPQWFRVTEFSKVPLA